LELSASLILMGILRLLDYYRHFPVGKMGLSFNEPEGLMNANTMLRCTSLYY